jgi:AraC-like DNA-binding protein
MKEPGSLHKSRSPRRPVTPVAYQAPSDYALDVELYPAAELRRRVGDADARGLERIDFHCLIYLTAGSYAHVVDFETEAMTPGSLLFLQPGQVHRFGDLSGCDGWLLVFKAELLPTRAESLAHPGADKSVDELELERLGDLPRSHLRLAAATRRAVTETLERMADDRIEPVVLRRYRRFRAAVERDFMRWHGVAAYADRLGCSEKSLARAALEVTDRTAKAVITDRLVLEAKRLLAQTLLPVAVIGDQLGFAEATNFVKFFRREAGLTPGSFRAKQRNQGSRIRST